MLLIGACILRPTESTILGAVFPVPLPSIDNLTCSIGGCRFAYGQNIEDVYAKADRLLYEAKKKAGTVMYWENCKKEALSEC